MFTRCGITILCLWFAFGVWAGSTLGMFVEIYNGAFSVRGVTDASSMVPFFVVLNIFMGAFFATPFGLWLLWRERRSQRKLLVSPVATLIGSFLFMPLFGLSVPLLCAIAGQEHGYRIGSLISLGLFGTPVILAELVARSGAISVTPRNNAIQPIRERKAD